jgi:hypothetical protein
VPCARAPPLLSWSPYSHRSQRVHDEEPRPAEGERVRNGPWEGDHERRAHCLAVAPTPLTSQWPPTDRGCLRAPGTGSPSLL